MLCLVPPARSQPRRWASDTLTVEFGGLAAAPKSSHRAAAAPSLESDGAASGPQPGDVLAGKYRVERLIGQGGMGLVVAATHLQLGSTVALKLLRPLYASLPNARGRLLREARVAARLRSEHAVRVYDVDECDDGTPFLVMEYLEGVDLDVYLRRGPLAAELAAELVWQACEALAEAHAHGFVHRDLKPSNLFLCRRTSTPQLKLLDFGVSKDLAPDPRLLPDGVESERNVILGTPSYMAPEQLLGEHPTDPRSDVWALGVILFEALSGQHPFEGRSFAAIVTALAERDPPWAALPASTPPGLRRVLERCLQKNPSERIDSARALADALDSFRLPAPPRAGAARAFRRPRRRASTTPRGLRAIHGELRAPRRRPTLDFVARANWQAALRWRVFLLVVLGGLSLFWVISGPPSAPRVVTAALGEATPSAGELGGLQPHAPVPDTPAAAASVAPR
ncbi:MAG: serine/threonine protein kinase [Polyangiaceae bacterium]|nr:serine/threonine protein kinase [Polyangiaceae bacterium]